MPSSEPRLWADDGVLTLPDAHLQYRPDFIREDQRASLFHCLRSELPWQTQHIRLFGKAVLQPRLLCWIGDADAVYTYSGRTQWPRPWHPRLRALKEQIEAATSARFNSVLANCYRSARDSMGWHADNERELGPAPVIASLSLGATRRFQLRHRERGLQHTLALTDGSLLVMAGDTQRHWQHAVPKETRPVGERINLTFRWVHPRSR